MEGRVINVRKLVALDIYLHGSRFILAEFGVGTPVIIAVGFWLILANILVLGMYLLLTGINYVPLLVYATIIARSRTAEKEVEYGLKHDEHYNRKYSVQQLMIFIPLTIVVLTILQEMKILNTPELSANG
jgi:uncharacterized membrane protein